MKRRRLIQCLVGAFIPIAGCGTYNRGGPPGRTLKIRHLRVKSVDSGYQLTVDVSTGGNPRVTIKDITVFAYSDQGQQVCEEVVGTLDSERMEATVSVTCSKFPAIITADAATSVCEELTIPVISWVGTGKQKRKRIPEELSGEAIVWNRSTRKCGESLPPERFVNGSGSITETAE